MSGFPRQERWAPRSYVPKFNPAHLSNRFFAGERRISMKGVSPWSKARLARRDWMAQAFSLKH
jgi:hypothetical protein